MKKTFTFLIALLISSYSFSQMDTIAGWTFPTGDMSDTIADFYNSYNSDKYIYTEGGTSTITFKNGATTKAAQATEWQDGKNTKSWQVSINSTDYGNLLVSSKQTAGGSNPGPRDFVVQYRIGLGGICNDVAGSEILVANDWTTGVIENIILPAECSNQANLYLQWLMTSNFDINGGTVLETGTAKIDDIFITGEILDEIDELEQISNITLFPNPCTSQFTINSDIKVESLEIYNIGGAKITDITIDSFNQIINTQKLPSGLYTIIIRKTYDFPETRLILVK